MNFFGHICNIIRKFFGHFRAAFISRESFTHAGYRAIQHNRGVKIYLISNWLCHEKSGKKVT